MKKNILLLLLLLGVCNIAFSQKVTKVTISTTAPLSEVIEKIKESGKQNKYGSKDIEVSSDTGKITLWQSIGKLSSSDLIIDCLAASKNGTTEVEFTMPKNNQIIVNYKKQLKDIISDLQLPKMLVGEFFEGIE